MENNDKKINECTKLYLEYLETKSPDTLKRFMEAYAELDQDGMIKVISNVSESLEDEKKHSR